MKYLLRVLFVAALPALLTMLIKKVDRRISAAPMPKQPLHSPLIDDLPVGEPRG